MRPERRLATAFAAAHACLPAFGFARLQGRDYARNPALARVRKLDERFAEDRFRIVIFLFRSAD
ncbi:MAG: hypothetical protein AMJ63_14710 [Myxococcales bacterium SG8_38_1]|nr:MAG: hypothetical protein AMJ63_14710 [Myxococcales bacterium SG8_38_1]